MDDQTITIIAGEIASALTGATAGRVVQMSRAGIAIQFRAARGDSFLFTSVAPADPRIYLIRRKLTELEKESIPPSPFALMLRKHLGGAMLTNATKDLTDRIVRLTFDARNATDGVMTRTLIAQLTGRSSNLLLLDEEGRIIDVLRRSPVSPLSSTLSGAGEVKAEGGMEIGDAYVAPSPPPQSAGQITKLSPIMRGTFITLSEAADDYYKGLDAARRFDARATIHRTRIGKEIEKRRKLQKNLQRDMEAVGDAVEHRRVGELLMANVATAERTDGCVRVIDYYSEGTPTLELDLDENTTMQEEAARRFALYAKAKRATQEIGARLEALTRELAEYEAKRNEIERLIAVRDEAALEALGEAQTSAKKPASEKRGGKASRQKSGEAVPRTRAYRSSDGYEIIVGRGARENDYVTFRIARPHDIWLHAADYPGAHVIVRNHARNAEVPQRTILEAAQLAAFSSKARDDPKVSVHYTARKYLSKPKGAAPGLVRLSNFRTLLVEPREAIERI